ncbi:MAG: tetratricopeptide repeat protein [Acidobacteriia bacterium]|nr:tetratricopeptide repeat protein [Terriglobia bacterium]
MKRKRAPNPTMAAVPHSGWTAGWTAKHIVISGLAAAAIVFEIYSPSLHGPFLLDDLYLPFMHPDADRLPIQGWLGSRPLLMVSFWFNYQLSGVDPVSYHVGNVALHLVAGLIAFLLLRKLLELAGEPDRGRDLLAAFGAGWFLLHPLQTEAVAYVASRSDVLSTLLAYLALLVFLRRQTQPMGVAKAVLVLFLFVCAGLTKQHAVVLPALFLLADYFWNPGFTLEGIRRNWKLHAPVMVGAVLGTALAFRMVRYDLSAGFRVREFTWYEYFFTQCRVFWLYIRLLILPAGQNADPEFAISRSLADPGAAIGLAGIVVLLGLAWWFRKRFPLAAFGVLFFVICLMPTSSFVPIRDPIAERRLYLPMLGFILIVLDLGRRLPVKRNALAGGMTAVLLLLGWLTYSRAQVWSSAFALWEDTAAKSPRKVRPRFQLAYAYYQEQRCAEASREFAHAARLDAPDTTLLVDWGLSLDCEGKLEQALIPLQQAAGKEPSAHIHSTIGMVYAKLGRYQEAMLALNRAQAIDDAYSMTFVYRGNVLAATGDWGKAKEQYQQALQRDQRNSVALQSLQLAERQLQGR